MKKTQYEEIKLVKESADAKYIPQLQELASSWIELETYDGGELKADAIVIESASIYQIYQSLKERNVSEKHCRPAFKIICSSETELLRWHRFLNKKYESQIISEELDGNLNAFEPVIERVNLNLNGEQISIDINLVTKNMLIQPAHLFIDAIKLTQEEQKIANTRLDSFRNYYRQTILGKEDVTGEMLEAAKRGVIDVYDREENRYSIPVGATALDFAYRIGKNLGNDASGAIIYHEVDGVWVVIPKSKLNTILDGKVKVEFITSDNQIIEPNRYELVTTKKAIANVREKITQQLIELKSKSDRRLQSSKDFLLNLDNGRYIKNIRKLLGIEANDPNIPYPEFIQKTRDRGVKIIEAMYFAKRGKKLDTHIDDVFTGIFKRRFGKLDDFLINVGLIGLPYDENGVWDQWEEKKLDFETITPSWEIVDRLITFRESRWILRINVHDESGVFGFVGNLLTEYKANVQTRTTPDNYSRGRKTFFEIRFTSGSKEAVRKIKKAIFERYGDNVLILSASREKDQKEDIAGINL